MTRVVAAEAADVTFPDIPEAQAEVLADELGPLVKRSEIDGRDFAFVMTRVDAEAAG